MMRRCQKLSAPGSLLQRAGAAWNNHSSPFADVKTIFEHGITAAAPGRGSKKICVWGAAGRNDSGGSGWDHSILWRGVASSSSAESKEKHTSSNKGPVNPNQWIRKSQFASKRARKAAANDTTIRLAQASTIQELLEVANTNPVTTSVNVAKYFSKMRKWLLGTDRIPSEFYYDLKFQTSRILKFVETGICRFDAGNIVGTLITCKDIHVPVPQALLSAIDSEVSKRPEEFRDAHLGTIIEAQARARLMFPTLALQAFERRVQDGVSVSTLSLDSISEACAQANHPSKVVAEALIRRLATDLRSFQSVRLPYIVRRVALAKPLDDEVSLAIANQITEQKDSMPAKTFAAIASALLMHSSHSLTCRLATTLEIDFGLLSTKWLIQLIQRLTSQEAKATISAPESELLKLFQALEATVISQLQGAIGEGSRVALLWAMVKINKAAAKPFLMQYEAQSRIALQTLNETHAAELRAAYIELGIDLPEVARESGGSATVTTDR